MFDKTNEEILKIIKTTEYQTWRINESINYSCYLICYVSIAIFSSLLLENALMSCLIGGVSLFFGCFVFDILYKIERKQIWGF